MDLALAMGMVMLGWLVVGGSLVGYGLTLRSLTTRRSAADPFEVFIAFWVGLCVVVGGLHLWHFVGAIGPLAGGITIGLGLTLLARRWRDLTPVFEWCGRERGTLLAVLGVGLWLANRAVGPGNAHDSGLYHFNVIRWTNEYPIVTGLANLAGPLGMNQSSLLFTAAVNHGLWDGLAHHVVNSLLVVVLATQAMPAAIRLINRRADGPSDLFVSGLLAAQLPVIVMLAVSKDISSPKTDLPAGLAMMACATILARALSTRLKDAAERPWMFETLAITLLATLGPCLKLSTAPTALGLWLLGAFVMVRMRPANRKPFGGLAVLVLASVVLFAPWVARSVVFSGYPLFPTRIVSIDVPWRVPDDHVSYLKGVIAKHGQGELPLFISSRLEDSPFKPIARLTKPPFDDRLDASGVNWVRAWFFSLPFVAPIEVVLPASVSLLMIVGLWWQGRSLFERVRAPTVGSGWWIAVPIGIGLVAWFAVAPVGRYAWPLWWLVAGVLLGSLLSRSDGLGAGPRTKLLVVFGLLVVLVPLPVRMGMVAVLERRNPLTSYPFLTGGTNAGFYETPSVELGTITTNHGLEVWVPTLNSPELVWDSPLPAVAWPPVDLDLAPRDPDDLGAGFEIRREPGREYDLYPAPRHDPEPREVLR